MRAEGGLRGTTLGRVGTLPATQALGSYSCRGVAASPRQLRTRSDHPQMLTARPASLLRALPILLHRLRSFATSRSMDHVMVAVRMPRCAVVRSRSLARLRRQPPPVLPAFPRHLRRVPAPLQPASAVYIAQSAYTGAAEHSRLAGLGFW